MRIRRNERYQFNMTVQYFAIRRAGGCGQPRPKQAAYFPNLSVNIMIGIHDAVELSMPTTDSYHIIGLTLENRQFCLSLLFSQSYNRQRCYIHSLSDRLPSESSMTHRKRHSRSAFADRRRYSFRERETKEDNLKYRATRFDDGLK